MSTGLRIMTVSDDEMVVEYTGEIDERPAVLEWRLGGRGRRERTAMQTLAEVRLTMLESPAFTEGEARSVLAHILSMVEGRS